MPQFRFGIRSILVLVTVVAVFMFGMNERQRYFREHVFVTVLDAANGTQVSEYRLRTWVITKDSGVAPEWSDWSKHNSPSSLPIKVPAHCRLVINVQAIGFPEGCHVEAGAMLVSPDLSHQCSMRITKSFQMTGSIVDATTSEPINRVVVAPTSGLNSQLLHDEAKTDSQGRFELYAVGKMTITSTGSKNLSDNREVAAFPLSVRGGAASMISDDSALLCEILTEESDKTIDELDSGKVILHGTEESEAWMERDSELSPDGFRRYRVFGRIDLKSGIYTVEINDGPFFVSLDIDYRRNQPPKSKLLLHRQVSASAGRESSGSMGGVKATLIRNGHVESHFHIPFDSEDLNDCFFESPGPFDVLFYDNSNGYALFENVSFSSESVELGEIAWQLGANISVDVSLHGLDLFPDKVSIRHEPTGVVHSEDHNWNYKTEFANLMLGKWTLEVTGVDPLVGKKTLFERTVELNSTENVHIALRRND